MPPTPEAELARNHAWRITSVDGQPSYPEYRVRQVLEWIIQRRAEAFETMINLPLTTPPATISWSGPSLVPGSCTTVVQPT